MRKRKIVKIFNGSFSGSDSLPRSYYWSRSRSGLWSISYSMSGLGSWSVSSSGYWSRIRSESGSKSES